MLMLFLSIICGHSHRTKQKCEKNGGKRSVQGCIFFKLNFFNFSTTFLDANLIHETLQNIWDVRVAVKDDNIERVYVEKQWEINAVEWKRPFLGQFFIICLYDMGIF